MPRYTDRFGLSILGPGDTLQSEGFKFTDADRRLIDRVLQYAAETHRHTGETAIDRSPETGLNLQLRTTGGAMPAGGRYYYRYTIIDADGTESAPSPIQSIDMPLVTTPPQAPNPQAILGTGQLGPGSYSYALSAWKDANTIETKATNSAIIRIGGTDPNNSVQLNLPALPLGASGFNVYRKSPSGMHYLWITAIGALTAWVDDGSIDGDCDRSLPPVNRTASTNSVILTYPGATPTVPDGWSWRIYRSENPTDWGRSYLTTVVPEGVTPTTPVSFVDIGSATQVGGPPAQAQLINAPSKINLTDAAEIQGSPPPGLVTVPHVVTFSQPGPVAIGEGQFTWVCPFEQADIISARAYLGAGSVPAADDVVVDIDASRPSQSLAAWTSIFEDGPNRPTVPAGEPIGEPSTPTITHLEAGDSLAVNVDQTGGGTPPTDVNLTVNVLMYIKHGSETVSHIWT